MLAVSRPLLGSQELAAVEAVFASGWLGQGGVSEQFEAELAEVIGRGPVVAVQSGTAALHLALKAYGIGPGDEVIVPSLTFAASVQAVLAIGATPRFCDVLEDSLLLDPADAKRRIGPRTRAVMPVHYGGSICAMDELLELAEEHRFVVIEDAAHAFGSRLGDRVIGSFGHATCFSFDPIKTITCGEGGAVALGDPFVAERLKKLRALGFSSSEVPPQLAALGARAVTGDGFRAHLPDLCAAIGRVQLGRLEEFSRRRRAIACRYDAAFAEVPGLRLRRVDYDEVVPHIYVVRVPAEHRQLFCAELEQQGIATGLHYPANHLQPHFRRFSDSPLPVAEAQWVTLVTLPLHCAMSDDDVTRVINAVRSARGCS